MIFISNLINESKTGSDKQETYRTLLSRHKLAMKHGFYFEALLIDYAMLEDRLVAFLWAAGVFNDADKFGLGNRRNKSQLRQLYNEYKGTDKTPILRNISAKIDMMLVLIDFAEQDYCEDDRYLSSLHKGLRELDLETLKGALLALDTWREYRNEVIHGAMTKNVYSLNDKLEENAVAGLAYARTIDNESKKLKRRTYIRRSVNMPVKK